MKIYRVWISVVILSAAFCCMPAKGYSNPALAEGIKEGGKALAMIFGRKVAEKILEQVEWEKYLEKTLGISLESKNKRFQKMVAFRLKTAISMLKESDRRDFQRDYNRYYAELKTAIGNLESFRYKKDAPKQLRHLWNQVEVKLNKRDDFSRRYRIWEMLVLKIAVTIVEAAEKGLYHEKGRPVYPGFLKEVKETVKKVLLKWARMDLTGKHKATFRKKDTSSFVELGTMRARIRIVSKTSWVRSSQYRVSLEFESLQGKRLPLGRHSGKAWKSLQAAQADAARVFKVQRKSQVRRQGIRREISKYCEKVLGKDYQWKVFKGGRLKSLYAIHLGKKHGLSRRWFKSGQLSFQGHFHRGKERGEHLWYFRGSKKIWKKNVYSLGASHRIENEFFSKGLLKSRREYLQTKKDGVWKKHGVWKKRTLSPRKLIVEQYHKGKLHGRQRWIRESRWGKPFYKPMREEHYRHNVKHGYFREWEGDLLSRKTKWILGKKVSEETWKPRITDGATVYVKSVWFYPGSRQVQLPPSLQLALKSYEKTVNRKKEGRWVVNYPNGNHRSIQHFSAGRKHGLFRTFWKDGSLRREFFYKHNKKDGAWKWWKRTGKKVWLFKQKSFKENLKDGPWLEWYSETKQRFIRHYKHNKKHGIWMLYDREGHRVQEEGYHQGLKNGTFRKWDRQHRLRKEVFYVLNREMLSIQHRFDSKGHQLVLKGSWNKGKTVKRTYRLLLLAPAPKKAATLKQPTPSRKAVPAPTSRPVTR